MSETDDTDVLLIIPPNFFSVPTSDSENSFLDSSRTVVQKQVSCTAQVLGKLVNRVHSLESRLGDLELDSSLNSTPKSQRCNTWNNNSCDSRSVDRTFFTFPRHRRKTKKINRGDGKAIKNLRSSAKELKYKENRITNSFDYLNDTQSMDGDISSIVSTPGKENDRLLLNEIDEFLTSVIPESTYQREEMICPDNVIKATGDYINQKLEPNSEVTLPSGRTISCNILDKYIYLVKNNQGHTSNASVSDDYEPQKQEKSNSIRRLNFTVNENVQPTSTPKQYLQSASSTNTFKPSSNKMYDRASRVLDQHNFPSSTRNSQSAVTDTETKKDEFKMPQMRPFLDSTDGLKMAALQVDSIDTDLLSLSELWGERGENAERVDSIKLEEERLKREHCEVIIQQLQKKVLDQQEKLAVAMKVDKGKDTAISKLREAWLRLTNSLSKAEERHKAALDRMVREVDSFRNVADDAQKKTNHFEKELYKTLDLAHDYQEKCKQLNSEKIKLQEDMEKMLTDKDNCIHMKEKEIESLRENYDTVMRLNKHSTDYVSNLETAIEKEKLNHEETKTKFKELQNKVQSMNEEKQLAEQERDILKEKVNEERSRCNILERQLCDSQNQVGELLKKCDSLDNEAKTLRKHLELQKTELKSHYQQQLEDAVLSKLQEFQKQLDLAQKDMDDATRSREVGLVDSYNKQISRIEEQHKLEVNVLEEKQKEEIKLYRLQLAQASEKIGLLENKVESWKKRRGEMAAQLHAVMQAQWTQALRILTRPQTSGGGTMSHGMHANTSHGSLAYAQLGAHAHASHGSHAYAPQGTRAYSSHGYPQYARAPGQAGRYALDDSAPETDYGLGELGSTRDEGLADGDLQRYIQQLLTKKPSFDQLEASPEGKESGEEPTSDRLDRPERRERARRNLNKPPWKA